MRRRAELVERTRAFFKTRVVLEVDTPVLQGGANLDPGIEPIALDAGTARFLPTSPEHPLKRLVAAGAGAVWTLAPAFRRNELGRLHAPEFRMLEWYRPGWDDARLQGETVELLDGLTGLGREVETLTYREAVRRHAGIDPLDADEATIARILGDAAQAARGDRAAALDLLIGLRVAPELGRGRWTIVTDFPPWAAAQARLRRGPDGNQWAARFEVFRDGVELANGYWELSDAGELAARLEAERLSRAAHIVRDARFEAAMAAGIGDCAGVAVGFDRVVMLALGLGSVTETQAFGWERA